MFCSTHRGAAETPSGHLIDRTLTFRGPDARQFNCTLQTAPIVVSALLVQRSEYRRYTECPKIAEITCEGLDKKVLFAPVSMRGSYRLLNCVSCKHGA